MNELWIADGFRLAIMHARRGATQPPLWIADGFRLAIITPNPTIANISCGLRTGSDWL